MNLTIFQKNVVIDDNTLVWDSLVVLLLISAIYLWFVLVAGPKFMSKREPINVTSLLRGYNILQVIVCTIYVTRAYQLGFTYNYLFKCERFEFLSAAAKQEVQLGCWLFLSLRLFEYVETIFFVLRKKQRQASFLHIFHHIGSVLMTWLFLASRAELMAVFIGTLNSTVHIFMYTYYFVSSFKSEKVHAVIKHIKPFITIIQLVQFVIIIAQCTVAVLPSCNFSYFFDVQIFNFILLFVLFARFFFQTYMRGDKKKITPGVSQS